VAREDKAPELEKHGDTYRGCDPVMIAYAYRRWCEAEQGSATGSPHEAPSPEHNDLRARAIWLGIVMHPGVQLHVATEAEYQAAKRAFVATLQNDVAALAERIAREKG
jgi:hypothetical protein